MRRQAILPGGPSSGGKSTLARALQHLLEAQGCEFGIVSIDDLLEMSPEEPIYEDDVFAITEELGARARDDCPTLTVRVACAPEVLRRREARRGDRCPGSAEASERYLYPKTGYDVTVDAGKMSPDECARRILQALD